MSDAFKQLLEIDDETSIRRDGAAAAEWHAEKVKRIDKETNEIKQRILADMFRHDHPLYSTAEFALVFAPDFAARVAHMGEHEIFMSQYCEILRAVKFLYEVEHGSEADHGT